jgi:hypothetical protein
VREADEAPTAAVVAEAPVGPSAEEEAAFIAEERENGYAPAAATSGPGGDEAEAGELPPLEDLVKRIPPATRDVMEELFRAKFVTVRRIPRAALK